MYICFSKHLSLVYLVWVHMCAFVEAGDNLRDLILHLYHVGPVNPSQLQQLGILVTWTVGTLFSLSLNHGQALAFMNSTVLILSFRRSAQSMLIQGSLPCGEAGPACCKPGIHGAERRPHCCGPPRSENPRTGRNCKRRRLSQNPDITMRY